MKYRRVWGFSPAPALQLALVAAVAEQAVVVEVAEAVQVVVAQVVEAEAEAEAEVGLAQVVEVEQAFVVWGPAERAVLAVAAVEREQVLLVVVAPAPAEWPVAGH